MKLKWIPEHIRPQIRKAAKAQVELEEKGKLKIYEDYKSQRMTSRLSDRTCGVAAEWAFADMYGYPYDFSVVNLSQGDFGIYEIKGTFNWNGNLLIHRAYEKKGRGLIFVFFRVEKDLRRAVLVGSIDGSDALVDKYRAEYMPRPCWKIPPRDLNDFTRNHNDV